MVYARTLPIVVVVMVFAGEWSLVLLRSQQNQFIHYQRRCIDTGRYKLHAKLSKKLRKLNLWQRRRRCRMIVFSIVAHVLSITRNFMQNNYVVGLEQ